MIRNGFNIALQHVHIRKHGIVDALQYVFWLALYNNFIGVVDESVAQRLDGLDGFRVDEMPRYLIKFVHEMSFLDATK